MKLSKDTREFQALTHDELKNALAALIQYQRRQDRSEHPDGSFDNARRWYPSDTENCGITSRVRSPSRSWPNSYMLACRTLDHCEDLNSARHADVLLVKRLLKKAGLEITGAHGEAESFEAKLTALHRYEDAQAVAPKQTKARVRT